MTVDVHRGRTWIVGLCLAILASGWLAAADPAPIPPADLDHPPPLSPTESVKHFKVPEDLGISLVVAEPDVSQPLSISFDDRGRMWVLQYLQYPNPNGLKAVEMDNWLRTKYDKIPDPPPKGPKGRDRISIYEDRDGDGRATLVKHFISDLNLGSGMALGYDGVFVVQSPYLLYYADRDHNDVPDGPPEVLLKGFGMEDAHAFANSLTWGPDGWLYGCQGSTATAEIRGIGFQQGVWRYHPRTKEFELFAEGGGNSWGVEFDRFGNVFSAGNEVELMVHMMQGAYYVKGFGKHGPLHNPHAYGYFPPVLHHGYVGDSLSGGAILYQGGAFPERYNNACIAPHTRHSASRWATVETRGSTFATRHVGDFITTDDIWFRPIESTVGPDGALYVADWYDYNISHSSPKNRSEWYQPSRFDGRVWRVAPPNVPPGKSDAFDLKRKTSEELITLLSHPNDWYAREARRNFAERRDAKVIPALTKLALESTDQRLALQGLWSVYVSGGFNDELALKTLASPHEYMRSWTARLLGDAKSISPEVRAALVKLAETDPSVIVRSQLACTAKRLPAKDGMAIVAQLVQYDSDMSDEFIPLLIWWAIENKAISDADIVLDLLTSPDAWKRPLMRQVILERLARRLAAEGSPEGYAAAARLFALAPTTEDTDILLKGTLLALSGQKLNQVPEPWQPKLTGWLAEKTPNPKAIELALRVNIAAATDVALNLINSPATESTIRVSIIKTLGETRTAAAIDPLLKLLQTGTPDALQVAALAALGYFNDERIGDVVLERYASLPASAKGPAIDLLCSRKAAAERLLKAVDTNRIAPAAVTLDQVQKLRGLNDDALTVLVSKHWGRLQTATPLEKQGRMFAVSIILARGTGDATRGREHFQKACANCHKLHNKGNTVGPDLTGAERKNRELLIRNIVDPSFMIREQFLSHVAATKDGRVLTGLLADSNADTITLLDAQNKRTVLNRKDIDELQESTASLMPEKLLDTLSDQQLRDLFAYLQSDKDVP